MPCTTRDWPCCRTGRPRLRAENSFEQAVGDQWGGQHRSPVPGTRTALPRRPDRVAAPAAAGQARPRHPPPHPACRAELDRWLAEPAIPARGYRDDFFLKIMAAVRSADPATLSSVLGRQRACLLRQLHALAFARATTSTTAVESLLITAAELHIRADLGVVDAAERPSPPPPPPPASRHHQAWHPRTAQRASPPRRRRRELVPSPVSSRPRRLQGPPCRCARVRSHGLRPRCVRSRCS